ncbi:MAG: polysaccharide biosynthesis protein [Clostridia bacterium]|nr:polysaccharide biosynthesis protein [Clostridia bacterium]
MPIRTGFLGSKKHPENVNKKSLNKFFSGVAVLTAANIIVKAIGLMFKIPLQHCIGDEGMGYFNSAYTVYTWFYMLSTAGIPVAISMIVSENYAKKNGRQLSRIFRVSLVMLIIIGALSLSVMLVLAGPFARFIGAGSASYSIMAVAPTLLFICISGAYRGYFQGHRNMVPTAISQVLEALGKMAVGICLALWASEQGYEVHFIAAYAALGITIGAAAGMLSLVLSKMISRQEKRFEAENPGTGTAPILRRLIGIAVPVTISSSVMSLTNVLDLMVVVNRLEHIGYTEGAAMAVYGNYTTLVVPMFNLPPILVYPIAYSVAPIISAAMTKKDIISVRRAVRMSLKLTSVISLPCAFGLAFMAYPMLDMLYSSQSACLGAPMLILLAPAVFFMCMLAVSNSALQAMGRVKIPILSMGVGAAVKLIFGYFLTGSSSVGIYGTPISTFACYLAASLVNIYFIIKHTGTELGLSAFFLKPAAAGAVCALSAFFIDRRLCGYFGQGIAVLLSILFAVIIYVILLFITGGVTAEELEMMPMAKKLTKAFRKK